VCCFSNCSWIGVVSLGEFVSTCSVITCDVFGLLLSLILSVHHCIQQGDAICRKGRCFNLLNHLVIWVWVRLYRQLGS
jgi:hypothetical protein